MIGKFDHVLIFIGSIRLPKISIRKSHVICLFQINYMKSHVCWKKWKLCIDHMITIVTFSPFKKFLIYIDFLFFFFPNNV